METLLAIWLICQHTAWMNSTTWLAIPQFCLELQFWRQVTSGKSQDKPPQYRFFFGMAIKTRLKTYLHVIE